MIPVSVLRTFKITGRVSLVESLFIKASKVASVFYNSAENYVKCISMFRREALLEISRNSLLTGGLHSLQVSAALLKRNS